LLSSRNPVASSFGTHCVQSALSPFS
jgi:hypothetical protein